MAQVACNGCSLPSWSFFALFFRDLLYADDRLDDLGSKNGNFRQSNKASKSRTMTKHLVEDKVIATKRTTV